MSVTQQQQLFTHYGWWFAANAVPLLAIKTRIFMVKNMLLSMLVLLMVSCDETTVASGSENKEEAIEGGISDIIRNPITADQEEIDTNNVAKITFSELSYEYARVDEGAVVSHDFSFVNTGKVPLIISNVRSTCGCTVADWPKTAIAPGEGGVIPVRFDTKNKSGRQNKPITITANTIPAKTTIYLNGQVDGESS